MISDERPFFFEGVDWLFPGHVGALLGVGF